MILSISAYSANNEKSIILNSSSLGDWSKAKKIKKSGKTTLQLWDQYIKHAKSLPESSFKRIMLKYDNKRNMDYDEIWIWERDDVFTKAEKKKFSGQFDIHKIYWKNNKVIGFTLEKLYFRSGY
jgi:hypothetical protein